MKRIPHNKRASPPKNVLEDLYLKQKLSMAAISRMYGTCNKVVERWLKEFDIPFRSHSDTMKMTYVHGRKSPDYKARSEKIRKTCLVKYGVDNVARIPRPRTPSPLRPDKETLERLYVHNRMSTPEIGKMYGVTPRTIFLWLEDMGIPKQKPDWKRRFEKTRVTCMKKYGRPYPLNTAALPKNPNQYHYTQEAFEILNDKEKFIQFLETQDTAMQASHCLGCGTKLIYKRLKKFNIPTDGIFNRFSSHAEMEIVDFIKTFYDGEIVQHDRKLLGNRRELDIFLPDLKLAIEFNGNWWHCEANADKYDAQKKYLGCLKKGIRLIQIYEWQWDGAERQQAMKDIIKKAVEKPTQGLLCSIMHNDIGNSHAYLAAGRKFSHVTEPSFWWIKGMKVYDGEEKTDEEMLADGWNRLYNAGMTIWS